MKRVEIFSCKKHRFMFVDNYLWMWDTPQEKELQEDLAKQSYGDVLVAGYGLGLVQKYLSDNKKVKSITTVELYKEVIDEMKKKEKIIGEIIIGDYNNLPENRKYDCIVGDIWPDIDAKFLKDYVKFKKKSKKLLKNKGKLLAWGKEYFEFLLKSKK